MIINGSDMLLAVENKCIGHSQEHTTNFNTETKDHAVKPVATAPKSKNLFKMVTVSGLDITVSFKGLAADDESELSISTLKELWYKAEPVTAELFDRPADGLKANADRKPYCKANFIITKLTESAPADDDVTYDGELKITGAPEIWTPGTVSDEALEV